MPNRPCLFLHALWIPVLLRRRELGPNLKLHQTLRQHVLNPPKSPSPRSSIFWLSFTAPAFLVSNHKVVVASYTFKSLLLGKPLSEVFAACCWLKEIMKDLVNSFSFFLHVFKENLVPNLFLELFFVMQLLTSRSPHTHDGEEQLSMCSGNSGEHSTLDHSQLK